MKLLKKRWRATNKRIVIVVVGVVMAVAVVGWLAATRLNAASIVFPLKVSSNGRYLVDQNNKPFFYDADTAWMTISRLSVADAKRYIDIKSGQGFSAIQASLLIWNRDDSGDKGAPFTGDMTQPNTAYWAGVDEIIKYAESKQMLVVAWPMWLADNGGWGGGSAPSESEYADYMTWVGNRYKTQGNIMWALGGDEEIDQLNGLTMAGEQALHAADPTHLMTYHPRSQAYNLRNENWLAYNSFQWNDNTGPKTYESIREGYDLSPTKPVLDAEPPYVPDPCCGDLKTSLQRNRANGWWAVLAGAMGVTYGGSRYGTWNIGADGNKDWDATADESGTHTGNIRKILEPFVWNKLVPDWDNQAVTGGRGSYGGTDYVGAGRADDGSLIVAYAPDGGSLTVDLSRLSGSATAQWFDPVSGQANGSAQSVSNSGSQSFSAPGNNAGGDGDWALIIYTSAGRAVDEVGPTPTPVPTAQATPTATPTANPTNQPTATPNPTNNPGTPTPVPNTPTPAPTPTPIPNLEGDLDHDGFVNLADLQRLLSDWGALPSTYDLNNDSKTDVYDLSILLSHF